MTILSGDIKLVASQVMDDVDEGGGAPTSNIIADGASNGIFNDISELDRAGGRVNLRKTFVSVQTTNTDGYFGANVIVADPPDDPLVSVSLFSTNDVFDQREDAKLRVESYLSQGPLYAGYLYGDHISGQGAVTILQRSEVALPVNGDTFVLRKNEGLSTETEQFVRVTKVTSRTRTFTDGQGDFQRTEVTLFLSDTLRSDFPGFEALRLDYLINYTNKTKTYTTIVADAARYYGVVPLTVDATLGDFTVKGSGIFTQIVPSTRVEVPIADARMNQQSSALINAGEPLTQTITIAFTTTQAMFIGGSILPSSLSVARGGVTITDKGGVLLNGTTQCGTVDYSNGVLALTANVFGGSSGSHTVIYTPASTPVVVSESIGIPITQQGQRLTYTIVVDPLPSRRSIQVSYRALGRWYVLTDDGSGAVKGSDSSFGAGTQNFTTGTLTLTLGALPDVGSQLIVAWVPAVVARPIAEVEPNGPTGNTGGFISVLAPGAPLKPGTVSITWNDGVSRTATDSNGELIGDASGPVYYGAGRIHFQPDVLPAKGTVLTLATTNVVPQVTTVSAFVDGGATWTFTLTGPIKPRSLELSVIGSYPLRQYPGTDQTVKACVRVFDDGAGHLVVANVSTNSTVGTVDYTTGACTLNKSTSGYKSEQAVFATVTTADQVPGSGGGLILYHDVTKTSQTGYELRSVTLSFLNGPSIGDTITNPAWTWWSGSQGVAAEVRYGGSDGSGNSYTFNFDQIFMGTDVRNTSVGHQNAGGSVITKFSLGTHQYFYDFGRGHYYVDVNHLTGEATLVGDRAVISGVNGLTLDAWPTGISPIPGFTAGNTNPSASGGESPMLVDGATFRTAISPLFNGGFNVSGTFSDGTTFTATPDSDGVLKTATSSVYGVVGKIDYDSGVVTLRFGKLGGTLGTGVQDVSYLEVTGVTNMTILGVQADTLRYNAVGYSYIPLNADILGLDPVRLPSDGRVPIFRPGSFAVLGNTDTTSTHTVANTNTIDCDRVRLSRVRVIGDDDATINTGYTVDLEAGIVTFTDVTGYSQPVRVEHRVEDLMLVSDAQINGQMTFTRALTHDYPADTSYISSALIAGDMHARVSITFDQATWGNVWSDGLIGSAATGTYNTVLAPIVVTNKGALTERWAIVFTNTTAFSVIGEHVGVIASGNTSTNCTPNNPATSQPYFSLAAAGWGSGWATGNVLRFNTVGALCPVWIIRTIQQGPETIADDEFTLLIRGDVDNP